MAELDFLYCASACSMPSSNKRFSRSLVTSGSRSIEECHCWLAPSAPHYSTTRIIPRVAQRDGAPHQRQKVSVPKGIRGVGSPVHTRLIPAIWLEFRKEGGSVACRGQRPRKRKSSIHGVVNAKRSEERRVGKEC